MAVFKNFKDDELIVSCKCGCDEGIHFKIADYEDPNLVFTKETFHSTSEGSLNYRKLEPPTIEKGKQYPLVIFLHGAGERLRQ